MDITLKEVLEKLSNAAQTNDAYQALQNESPDLAEKLVNYFTDLSNIGADQLTKLDLGKQNTITLISMMTSHAAISNENLMFLLAVSEFSKRYPFELPLFVGYILRIGIGLSIVEELR